MDKRAALQKLYGSGRWRKRAKHQLRNEPFCRFCLALGEITAARVADHVHPHHGDVNQFWCGELQSLCFACHDHKRFEERRGYDNAIGPDGWPRDPRHPVYQGRLPAKPKAPPVDPVSMLIAAGPSKTKPR
jgi:5-methylcytosine-specific restriction endonuclease McrA